MTVNDGRLVFDSKTEFSYSSDSRKTLTLTSKVEDISYGYTNKNYSMALGLSHPYTDVDVQLRSNIGKSSEKFTGAMDIMYLTARRERKNFALRGEINRIRNQLNLQVCITKIVSTEFVQNISEIFTVDISLLVLGIHCIISWRSKTFYLSDGITFEEHESLRRD